MTYWILPLALDNWLKTPDARSVDYYVHDDMARINGFAPVFIWNEAPPSKRDYHRLTYAARLVVLRGEAFAGDRHIPREKIAAYLNTKVRRREIDSVVIFSTNGTRLSELMPVLDECRKSEVRVVYLNETEA